MRLGLHKQVSLRLLLFLCSLSLFNFHPKFFSQISCPVYHLINDRIGDRHILFNWVFLSLACRGAWLAADLMFKEAAQSLDDLADDYSTQTP